MMLRTLYAKLSSALALLLIVVGVVYAVFTVSATQDYLREVNQRLNRDLARDLVADRNLVQQGQINAPALKETFHQYMMINPSIEIYLLDRDGTILSYSADPGKVKRRKVSLEPVHALLRGGSDYPVLGDDPRHYDRRKAFSVTPVPSVESPEGYLYVILRGEEFDSVDALIRESYLLRLSGWAVAASLILGLLLGLILFRMLTWRIQRLGGIMEDFRKSNFSALVRYEGLTHRSSGDEIDRLGRTFEEMAQRIIEQFKELTKKDALRRELVAQVSHDLRTPLASLHGYLETLQIKDEALKSAERAEYLAIALRHSERLRRLVEDLFELAKLDAKDTRPRLEPVALAELAQDVLQKFQLVVQRSQIRLEFRPLGEVSFARADIGLIERVLENLIDNAIRHSSESGLVHVEVWQQGALAHVSVSDNGCGIPPADISRIFDRFFQSSAKEQDDHHAGLGLAIAKRIVELHKGKIRVSSEPNTGTTFTFSLPIWQSESCSSCDGKQ